MTQPQIPDRQQPQSLTDLFFSFNAMAMQGFGGVLPVIQRELVERKRWMTRDEFLEEWAVAQILPGPNVVNMSIMVGERYFGLRGSVAALTGLMLVPLIILLALALVYAQFATNPQVAGALRGMGAVAAGLIGATALKLAGPLRQHPLGLFVTALLALAAFVAVGLLGLPLWQVLLGLGGLSCLLTWRKLGSS